MSLKTVIPSKKCVELIKSFEGFSAKAYLCPAGVWTIGYGTTVYTNGKPVSKGDTCTIEQAEQYLQWDIQPLLTPLVRAVSPAELNSNQFDALLSFIYNVGTTAFTKSTLLKKVRNNPDDPAIKDEFAKWVNGGGKKLPGLVKRRKAEADLYFQPTQ